MYFYGNFLNESQYLHLFKNGNPLMSSVQNIDILSGSPTSGKHQRLYSTFQMEGSKDKQGIQDR